MLKYRLLGKTSLKVSEIGLWTEYLARQTDNLISTESDKSWYKLL
ncbi:MAG: hypothetical protein ACW98A_14910 [Candidatus Hodarchaeales archaeon]|jgi:hypothetical protein